MNEYKKVLMELAKIPVFHGIYDAKHGSKHFMHGVRMVMEEIAARAGDKQFVEEFEENIKNSLDKVGKLDQNNNRKKERKTKLYDYDYEELYDEGVEPTEDYLEEYFYEVEDGSEEGLKEFIDGCKEHYNGREQRDKEMEEFAQALALRVYRTIAKEAKKLKLLNRYDLDDKFQDDYRDLLNQRED